MKKIFIIALAVSLAACNAGVSSDTVACSYDLAKNERTCNLTKTERHDLKISGLDVEESTKIRTSDGKTLVEQADGTYAEEKK